MTTNPKRKPASDGMPEAPAAHAVVDAGGMVSWQPPEPVSSDPLRGPANPTLTSFVRALARAASRRDWAHGLAGIAVGGCNPNEPKETP